MTGTDPDFAPPGDVASFPVRPLRTGTNLFRIHHAELGPCWFSSSEVESEAGNRFDLTPPKGTSYWALKPEAAFLETLARRPVSIFPLELIDRYQLTTATVPREFSAANAPVKRARSFGLTAEFFTTPRYALTRPWANTLAKAGFKALLYIPRHDVTAKLRSLAIFGDGGEHPPFGWKWKMNTSPIPTQVIDEMSDWGIRCLPIPFDVPTIDP